MNRLPGGMASPWINFLVCFRKRVDSQRGYEKGGLDDRLFRIFIFNFLFWEGT